MRTHNQNNKLNKKIIQSVLYSMIIAGAAGAATGTYAWYTYQKEVSIDFSGTAINKSDEIEVGLRVLTADRTTLLQTNKAIDIDGNSEHNVSFDTYYNNDMTVGQITTEEVGLETIYWIRGNYIQEVLTNFAVCYGSAIKNLAPITAGYFEEGMTWDLKNTSGTADEDGKWSGFKQTPLPKAGMYEKKDWASEEDYFFLPLAFRVKDSDKAATQPYKASEPVYLSQFSVEDKTRAQSDTYDLAKAVRCKVDMVQTANHAGDYIFNPTADDADDLFVGGVLNLNGDAYYDYTGTGASRKEIAYGQFEGDPKYASDAWEDVPSKNIDDCTTFSANHIVGAQVLLDKSEDEFNARTCETRGKAVVDSTRTTTPFVTTNSSGYAFVDMSIYIEGWDENVLDQTAAHEFAVSLEFAISKE